MNKPTTPAGTHQNAHGVEPGVEGNDFLTANLRLLENWYAVEVERRLKDITAVLHDEMQRQVNQMEEQYKQRGNTNGTVPALTAGTSAETLAEEIARSEASLDECSALLESLIGDDGSKLVNLLRARSQELELKAYLRGLKFRAGTES